MQIIFGILSQSYSDFGFLIRSLQARAWVRTWTFWVNSFGTVCPPQQEIMTPAMCSVSPSGEVAYILLCKFTVI